MAPREPRSVEHPDTMSGKAPHHWLELGVMDPQGHSPAELVLEPRQPHKPGSLWVNGQCPHPCWLPCCQWLPAHCHPQWVLLPDHGWVLEAQA